MLVNLTTRERGFAVGVRGHGSGEGERPGEMAGALSWISEEDYREILELCAQVEALFED
jgi:hypothetical protein